MSELLMLRDFRGMTDSQLLWSAVEAMVELNVGPCPNDPMTRQEMRLLMMVVRERGLDRK